MLVHSSTEYHGSSEQDNGEIAKSYADFAIRHYGPATTVVFDGYEEGPSIKDNTHQRRGCNMHPVVSFTTETEFSGKSEERVRGRERDGKRGREGGRGKGRERDGWREGGGKGEGEREGERWMEAGM